MSVPENLFGIKMRLLQKFSFATATAEMKRDKE
jgi:hypothetical protein